ncbi:PREDICTED: cytochrome P450 4C1-like [Polistes canadensis]|uniref:cytochrome P450 4C1-like n=1 Tax=Polistes canadensis TaxID=91411 RepID=UPI000718F775|nr:PREDICTED: cytochrome P450 4C1-like [Polistes canadensis]XP_014605810.1 PREDICTED: cytochrome P450 4C1-like [Polistes canadensis]XP_014605811.1 PREDICTED: cytochrome P450 4C1-like [Polistes canadensis]
MFLMILTSLILFLFILHCYIRYRREGRLLNQIPGPKEYPLIGNMHHFQVPNEIFMKKYWNFGEEFYPIFKIWSLFFSSIILLHPEDIKIFMTSKKLTNKYVPYKYMESWLSTGLLTSGGEKWQQRRKILTPTFHFDIIKHFLVTFNEEAQFLVRSLREEAQEQDDGFIVVDLLQLITKHSLNIICETILGISLKEKGNLESEYRNAVHGYGKIIPYRFVRPWYHFDKLFAFSPTGRLEKKLLKTLHNFSKNIIAERMRFHEQTDYKYLQNLNQVNEENEIISEELEEYNKRTGLKRKLCLLDLLIVLNLENKQIDYDGIREEVDTFMFEGHDTTAMVLCFALSLFAKHRNVQENIRREVNTVMQREDCKLTTSMLQDCSYLERCIKESLRLYPSVHTIFRYLNEDLQLSNYVVPAGSSCQVSIYNVHRNPIYWPNPDIFDPDRFLPENMKERHPYSYIPFSAGMRNCIGQKFAMFELKVLIAHILHNFNLEPVDELEDVIINADITMNPSKPLHVKFIPI